MDRIPTTGDRKPKTYRISIIEGDVDLPEELDREYDDLDEAYNDLCAFVHSYDGIMQVDGRVLDEDDEDVEYASSIMY